MAAVSGAGDKSQELKLNYLNLLVTQMRYQNPLEPMDNAQMTAQLAQISQLEQLEAINSRFAAALEAADARYVTSLIGKEVTFDLGGGEGFGTGRVAGAERMDETFYLRIGDYLVAVEDVVSVRE